MSATESKVMKLRLFSNSLWNKIISSFLILYSLSLCLSMAGMEAFSWGALLLFTCAVAVWFYRHKVFLIVKTGYEWPLLGYWGVVLLSTFIISDLTKNDIADMIGGPRWILLFFFFFVVLQSQFVNRERLIKFFVISSLVASVYGVYQSQTGIDLFRSVPFKPTSFGSIEIWRSKGFFSSVMTYANSMGLAFCFLFGFQWVGKGFQERKWKLTTNLTLIFLALAILTSLTRGLWLGVFVSVLIMAIIKKRVLGIAVIVFTLSAAILLYKTNEGVRVRMNNAVSVKHPSIKDRIFLWKAHLAMFKDHPLMGIGLNMSEKHIHTYHMKVNGEPGLMSHAHNNIIQVLSSTGILGLIFFLWFMIKILVDGIKGIKTSDENTLNYGLLVGFIGAFICLHISGLTEANFFDGEVLHLFLFLTAISLTALPAFRVSSK